MKRKVVTLIGVALLMLSHILSTTSCSTLPTKTGGSKIPRQEIEKKTPHSVAVKSINEKETLRKIGQFESAVRKRVSGLTQTDWKLHDDLLATYIQLKGQLIQGTKIRVPARSRFKIDLPSFCLNSGRASPTDTEGFQWIKKDPNILYYKELLKLSSANEIKQTDAQTLLWNLQNKTHWENYPDDLKAILQKIDPKASLKLPSKVKDAVKDTAIDYLKSQVPFADKIEDAVSLVEGEYYKYDDYARSIQEVVSKYSLEKTDTLTPVPSTALYSDIQSEGYSIQNVTLYNPTNQHQEIDLADYYLQPDRKDVQRIGLTGRSQQSGLDLLVRLEKVLYDSMARFGLGFTPIFGDVADIYELLTGKDFLNGQDLRWGERLLSGVGIVVGSGAGYRYAARAAHAPEEFIPKFERGFAQVAKREINLSTQELKNAREFIAQTKATEKAIQASPTLRKTFENPNFKKTDFYVRPNGEIIPAKAYRYVPSTAPYREELVRTGRVPENSNGTYLSFNKYDQPGIARDRLQLYEKNDAAIRIELDTKQVLEDVRILRGRYGTADHLEPLTKDYPEYGVGRATQAVTYEGIQASRIVDLKTGKVIYEAK